MIDIVISILMAISYIAITLAKVLLFIFLFWCICNYIGVIKINRVCGYDMTDIFLNNSILLGFISLLCILVALILKANQLS